MRRLALALLALLQVAAAAPAGAADETLRIGSKRFTESYVLAEILARTAAGAAPAVHLRGLGNTAIVYEALRQGSIDLYPEYLGTIEREILKLERPTGSIEEVNRRLAPLGLAASIPFGFANSYALALRGDAAARLGLASIGDLAARPELRFGLSHEFLGRADGWPGLKTRYGLPQHATGLDHGLAYEALAAGTIDVIDVYSTDAKLARYGLTVLEDDRGYFPRYDALVLHRLDVPERFPEAWSALLKLAGSIDEARMIELNAAAELHGRSFADIARAFVAGRDPQRPGAGSTPGLWQALAARDFWRLARQHVLLVLVSVGAAVLVGVPAGVLAAVRPRFGAILLPAVGALQTVPSLALLALLISAIGAIGTLPALVALFAYALLPIVRNTCTGLSELPAGLRDAATALGMRPGQRIVLVELPIVLPLVVAGIRTAAVINVGTATIAAFVGAGGFGERIATGLALNDRQLLLAGALPAAGLAFLIEGAFALLERRLSRWSRASRA